MPFLTCSRTLRFFAAHIDKLITTAMLKIAPIAIKVIILLLHLIVVGKTDAPCETDGRSWGSSTKNALTFSGDSWVKSNKMGNVIWRWHDGDIASKVLNWIRIYVCTSTRLLLHPFIMAKYRAALTPSHLKISQLYPSVFLQLSRSQLCPNGLTEDLLRKLA